MTKDQGEDGYRGDLNDRCVTIAKVLRSAGYRTAMTGKWHVTKFVRHATKRRNTTGLCSAASTATSASSKGAPTTFSASPLTLQNESVPPGDGFYTTDAFADHAIQFTGQGEKTKPFFLYLAYNAPHFPLNGAGGRDRQASAANTRSAGTCSASDGPRPEHELGVVDKAWPLSPGPAAVKA